MRFYLRVILRQSEDIMDKRKVKPLILHQWLLNYCLHWIIPSILNIISVKSNTHWSIPSISWNIRIKFTYPWDHTSKSKVNSYLVKILILLWTVPAFYKIWVKNLVFWWSVPPFLDLEYSIYMNIFLLFVRKYVFFVCGCVIINIS